MQDVFRIAPITTADRIIVEIRKFIAAAIFFNAQAADQVGLGLTDMQMVHMLQLHGPATPKQLGLWAGSSSGGVTGALDRLEEAGYLRREPNPTTAEACWWHWFRRAYAS
jgi:DNA-binding MarR family transcriptional regulator